MSPQYGKHPPTNGWDRLACLGHPSKFQRVSHLGFVTAAASLTAGQPGFALCLAISWASTLYIYIFRGCCAPWRNFARCKIHFASKFCIILYWQHYCTELQQRASTNLCGMVQGMEVLNFRRGRHLYLAGQPSRWASAHILVLDLLWCWYKLTRCRMNSIKFRFHFQKLSLYWWFVGVMLSEVCKQEV